MRVNWYTQDKVAQKVRFGASPANLTIIASEEASSPRQYLLGHGFHHVALLNCGAEPGLLGGWVYYKVGSDATGWSGTFRFDTRPFAPGATTRVSVFGDLGFENSTYRRKKDVVADAASDLLRQEEHLTSHWSATWTRNYVEDLKNRGAIDAVIHLGDIGCEYYNVVSVKTTFLFSGFFDTHTHTNTHTTHTRPLCFSLLLLLLLPPPARPPARPRSRPPVVVAAAAAAPLIQTHAHITYARNRRR
jgi:hypothetical protein